MCVCVEKFSRRIQRFQISVRMKMALMRAKTYMWLTKIRKYPLKRLATSVACVEARRTKIQDPTDN